jgi:hypothetical protein
MFAFGVLEEAEDSGNGDGADGEINIKTPSP